MSSCQGIFEVKSCVYVWFVNLGLPRAVSPARCWGDSWSPRATKFALKPVSQSLSLVVAQTKMLTLAKWSLGGIFGFSAVVVWCSLGLPILGKLSTAKAMFTRDRSQMDPTLSWNGPFLFTRYRSAYQRLSTRGRSGIVRY